ncbi:hypothetical protein Nepgr_028299 [Nepenthes gracilis]|uniref:C2 domain-containing protein n=1 Tax=Nepenthes gracilis TaxID=150966 RepID=A0AAD3TC73_NEPGR|nr:hypothetical protein Nepgr_028299 [Nepenthes gracilis]
MGINGKLEVPLVGCKGIRNTEFLAKMDPFVIIQYGNQEHRSSVTKGEGRNPVWNENFTFNVDYPGDAVHKYKLIFHIMDKHTHSPDDLDGQTTIYLKDVISLGVEKGEMKLEPRKYRVVLPNQKYAGEITVGITFTLNDSISKARSSL